MTKAVRVRYAPSPTGHLHIGNARTAIFNFLYARSQQGSFIIRIEDTDQKRNVAGGEWNQLNYLKWLGLDWDESIDKDGGYGPYRQSERLHLYAEHAQQLLEKGLAYKCYCTVEELEQEREEQIARGETPHYSGKHRHLTQEQEQAFEKEGRQASIRFRVPQNRVYAFQDGVKGDVSFDSVGIGDFVIVKQDGFPTYNFAVAVDDHLMHISHVLRGDDHITNTPLQLMIYEAFGWEPPAFIHMTLIVNEERKKLSKRDESIIQFIEQYDQLGYLPQAMFNFIVLLGWSPEGEEEIFSRAEFINIFDPERLSKSSAVFDTQKLAWMNNQYIKQLSEEELVQLALPYLQKENLLPEVLSHDQLTWARRLIVLHQEKLDCVSDIPELSTLFFQDHIDYAEEAKAVLSQEGVSEVLQAFGQKIAELEPYEPAEIKQAIKDVQKETGFKGKQLFMPIRVACTGQAHGPDLIQSLWLLGRKKISDRIAQVVS